MRFLLFSLFILPIISLVAQEEITVTMKNKSFSIGEVAAFVTFIPQADYDELTKDWEKYLKQDTKEKTISENGEIVILNKEYERISAIPLNIYSYIKEYDGEIMLVVAMELEGQYISKDMDEEIYIPAKKYVRDFAVESYKTAVGNQLKEEEKILKKLESQKLSLQNSRESIVAEINQYERTIIAKKDEITLNQIDQSDKVVQMQAQKELVLKLANAGEMEKDDASKILKEIEKDFKKLQKENENFYQDIDYAESEIRRGEIKLAKVESDIKFMQLDIDDQAYRVRKIEQKLERIK